jgi:hypothetical protein
MSGFIPPFPIILRGFNRDIILIALVIEQCPKINTQDWQTKIVTITLNVRLSVLLGNRIRSPKRVIRWRARRHDDVRRRSLY